MMGSIWRKSFNSHDTLLMAAQNAFLSGLRRSSLAAVIDSKHIQTTLHGPKRIRMAHNVRLKTDGTVAVEDTQPATDVGVSPKPKAISYLSHLSAFNNKKFPSRISESLGFLSGSITVLPPKPGKSDAEGLIDSGMVLDAMANFIQPWNETGLAGYTSLAIHLVENFGERAAVRITSTLGPVTLDPSFCVKPLDIHLPVKIVSELNIARSALQGPALVLYVPITRLKTRVRRGGDEFTITCETYLYLQSYGDTKPRTTLRSFEHDSPVQEAKRMCEATLTVLNALCGGMSFVSLDLLPRLLAEGVLRKLGGRLWSVKVGGARVSLHNAELHVCAEAIWDSGNSVQEHQLPIVSTKPRDTTKPYDDLATNKGIQHQDDPALDNDGMVTAASTMSDGDVANDMGQAAQVDASLAENPGDVAVRTPVDAVCTSTRGHAGRESSDTTNDVFAGTCESHTTGVSRNGIYIALGSNVGDRVEAIEEACRAMDDDPDIDVLRTSNLYETAPMYVEDQAYFLNGVCEIATLLPPIDLLNKLQAIERDLGRVKTIDKGPRSIDLDILLYRDERVDVDRLTIPHKLMWEREFVLRPLVDVCLTKVQSPSGLRKPLMLVQALPPSSSPMHTFVPLTPSMDALRSTNPLRPTHIMSILNTTPDSFSDGGLNEPTDLNTLKATVAAHIAAGSTIIDIGGQSSRPNAPDITAEEEIARVLPAIEAIKSLPDSNKVAISIDTYRAVVAEAAVNAGAHIVNDISAGLLDPNMLPTIARLGCTYIMMHMRGTPATMQSEENCSYPDGLIETVAAELDDRLKAAQDAGVRRWRIVLDPGIGFAKTQEQNLYLLRNLRGLRSSPQRFGLPWLVGTSRKGFIGKITGVQEAKERKWGTAATVTAAVAGGADIVRVHDVGEMAQVAKMADAMYRA